MNLTYDVIVVGGGHAGNEAAVAAANRGASVLLVSMNLQTLGQMSCNPAMGGIAKGQIVREIDALGGFAGQVADTSAIQFRMLNRRKGEAMWSPRTQNDRMRFAEAWRNRLEASPNLDLWQDTVTHLDIQGDVVKGVYTGLGMHFQAKAVILTAGTFMNGLIHIGPKQIGGGRMGDKASFGLTEQLVSLGMQAGRMKTGTPPRIDGRTIDYSVLEEQPGDDNPQRFSYLPGPALTSQRSCYIGYTNPKVHQMLASALDQSPLYNGTIDSVGPRYCPSIEDKIVRFADKSRHQLFVEPEGWNTCEIYLNGFSSSLPMDVQYKALQLIPGFEKAKMFRPGYAIEYDYFPPHQLKLSLETQRIHGLFFAGQINGTTGYEEAGCQGLLAGINAVQFLKDDAPLVLKRSEAYIGVLIDDLIHKSTDEPYRMFTSRAEYRLTLRQDNADARLTPIGRQLGLVDDTRWEVFTAKQEQVAHFHSLLENTPITPEAINPLLEANDTATLRQAIKASQLLTRPQLSLQDVLNSSPVLQEATASLPDEAVQQAYIQVKYAGYVAKEAQLVEKMVRLENVPIPAGFDFQAIKALRTESRLKLAEVQPVSLGHAARVSGVNPADIQVLMVHLNR